MTVSGAEFLLPAPLVATTTYCPASSVLTEVIEMDALEEPFEKVFVIEILSEADSMVPSRTQETELRGLLKETRACIVKSSPGRYCRVDESTKKVTKGGTAKRLACIKHQS